MSDNEEDDKATVVLDINELKKQMQEKKATGSEAIDQDVEFSVKPGEDSTSDDTDQENGPAENDQELSLDDDLEEDSELEEAKKVILFDYKSEYFNKLSKKLPDNFNYQIINELKELNKILTSKEEVVIMFNYNAAPKAINQLTTQIKSKFNNAKTIIIAKGLTEDKAKQHQNSKAGADAYLSVPFNINKFEQTIKDV